MKAVTLFRGMEPGRRAALRAAAEVVDVARGQDLDTKDDALILLVEGALAMMIGEGGRSAVAATISAPAVLNLDVVTMGKGDHVGWRALVSSRVLLIPGDDFRTALAADPCLAARALDEMAGAYRRLLAWASSQRLQSAQQRVAGYLLSLTAETVGEAVVELPYEKHLLASLLGMTPENFSRALARLSAHGIQVRGAKVRLERIEALRGLVEVVAP